MSITTRRPLLPPDLITADRCLQEDKGFRFSYITDKSHLIDSEGNLLQPLDRYLGIK